MKRFSQQDILDSDWLFRRNFVNSLTGFKSLNLIGTRDRNGAENVAVFNSMVHIGATPPFMGFILRPLTVPRETYQNILATGYFTANHVHGGIVAEAHQTSAKYERGISEFEATGLTPHYEKGFAAPYVGEAKIRMGLRFVEDHPIAANGTLLIVGAVEECFVPEEAISPDGFIDLSAANTAAGVGLDAYYNVGNHVRFQFARPGQDTEELKF